MLRIIFPYIFIHLLMGRLSKNNVKKRTYKANGVSDLLRALTEQQLQS